MNKYYNKTILYITIYEIIDKIFGEKLINKTEKGDENSN